MADLAGSTGRGVRVMSGLAVVAAGICSVFAASSPERGGAPVPPVASTLARHAQRVTHWSSSNGTAYLYAEAATWSHVTSVSAQLMQEQPKLAWSDVHSLAEIAVQDTMQRQVVEVGWSVTYPGAKPALFVFHWVNGQETCYNGCGWVQVSRTYKPGQTVAVGKAAEYGIQYERGKWWVTYQNQRIGYFPERLWKGRFTSSSDTQLFSEVATSDPKHTCAEMGNGLSAANSRAATFAGIRVNGRSGTRLTMYVDPGYSMAARPSADGFSFGGAGNCVVR